MIRALHPLAKLVAAIAAIAVVSVSEQGMTHASIAVAAFAVMQGEGRPRLGRLSRLMTPFLFFAATSSWIYLVAENPAHRAAGGAGWQAALIVAGRILTVGLISLAFSETTRPADLARALVQDWRLSKRFVFGALAAIQFMPALAEDYRMARLIGRAGAAGSPSGRPGSRWLRLLLAGRNLETALVIFAGALRRASAAALSMQMRGLGSAAPNSQWRRWPFRFADAAFLAGTAVFLGLAVHVAR